MKRQAGFAPLLVIIVTSVLGMTTLVAADSYSEYTQRAVVSTGMQMSEDLKKAVAVYMSSTGGFPKSNAEVEMPEPEMLGDKNISTMAIGTEPVEGAITITFKANGALAAGDQLVLVPSIVGNRLKWTCQSETIISDLLPESCRS